MVDIYFRTTKGELNCATRVWVDECPTNYFATITTLAKNYLDEISFEDVIAGITSISIRIAPM